MGLITNKNITNNICNEIAKKMKKGKYDDRIIFENYPSLTIHFMEIKNRFSIAGYNILLHQIDDFVYFNVSSRKTKMDLPYYINRKKEI